MYILFKENQLNDLGIVYLQINKGLDLYGVLAPCVTIDDSGIHPVEPSPGIQPLALIAIGGCGTTNILLERTRPGQV